MYILVVGLGSMGLRRIRLLKEYNPKLKIIGVDTNESRRLKVESEKNIKTENELDEALRTYNFLAAFICTSPLSHGTIISKCLENNLHIFSELNLVDDAYDKNIKLAQEKGKILFLSSTMLYRAEINKIFEEVKTYHGQLNYTYHVGQYLPDWHPWENYKDFFVFNKRSNACRELFAVELPWILEAFGDIKSIVVKKDKLSDLSLNYNDNYLVLIEHTTGHKGTLALDVISRKATRNLEIFGEHLHITWDGKPNTLKKFDLHSKTQEAYTFYSQINQDSNYENYVVENAYYDEIVAFFDSVHFKTEPLYSFEKDKMILKWIDEIEG